MGWVLTAEVAALALLALLALVVLPLVWLFGRRRWLSSGGGVFDCALRIKEHGPAGGWAIGMGRVVDDELRWYRTFSLRLGPSLVLRRDDTSQLGTRAPEDDEAVVMFSGDAVLRLADSSHRQWVVRELAMDRSSLTGVMSWLEAAPPGGDGYSGLERR